MFKNLSDEETVEYKKWARSHYTTGEPINSVWHPVVQKECRIMNAEQTIRDFIDLVHSDPAILHDPVISNLVDKLKSRL